MAIAHLDVPAYITYLGFTESLVVGQICADLGPNCSVSVKSTKFSGDIEKIMGINM